MTVNASDRAVGAPPNILFILSDDQGYWAMGNSGNTELRTPNLDRLASTGMRFENFFCASPVCSPARATILTGRMPSEHGVHDWIRTGNTTAEYEPDGSGELIRYLRNLTCYTDCLREAGYACGMIGKWHLGDSHHPQKGFDHWEVHVRGGGQYYGAPLVRNGNVCVEPRYLTDAVTDSALRFLEKQKTKGNPFYLSVHYTAPHAPWERMHHPEDLFDEYYQNCPFQSVPDGISVPEWVRVLRMPARDSETRRVWMSGYYAAITAMDAGIGRLLDWLETNDLRGDTLVIFTSDNGMCMGHHGFFGKGNGTYPLNMFEESVRVPFIASRPGWVPQNTTAAALLSQYDLFPTLLDCAGLWVPEAVTPTPGHSFMPLLKGGAYQGREDVVIFDEYGPVRMVRTAEWKYVHRYPEGPHELYDLINDPQETHNLVSEPGHSRVARDLRLRLEDWFERYQNPDLDGRHLDVTGCGQKSLVKLDIEGGSAFFQS